MSGEGLSSSDVASSVLLLNGPNLNLLESRDSAVYGSVGIADIERRIVDLGKEMGVSVRCAQSNSEGGMIDLIQQSRNGLGLIINPGAYGHYSYAIRDAIEMLSIPVVEVHISNIHAREEFRHKSVISPVVTGFICGCGVFGYELALRAIANRLEAGSR